MGGDSGFMKQLSKIAPRDPRGGRFLPPPWEICPAKNSPFKTLRQHALETGAVFKALCLFLQLREDLLPPSALLFAMGHDCGKLSPGFISKLPGDFAGKNGIPETREFQRHEVISESAFRAYLKRRSDSCETIVGWHHGRRNPSVQTEGVCDYGGETWQVRRREFLDWIFSFDSLPANSFSAENRLLSAGVVCLADWIASNESFFTAGQTALSLEELEQAAVKVLEKIGFQRPEWKTGLRFEEVFPPYSPNSAQAALAEVAVAPGIYLLENTMGSGKTEAALYAAYRLISSGVNRGIFFALPTRLTSNRIYERVNRFLERVSGSGRARLIHGTAWLEPAGGGELEAGASWFAPSKRALLEPFGVGTVDQALKGVLNVKHFFVRLLGLAGKVVVIDEVHAFDDYMHFLLVNLCRILVRLDCTVILLSATLPAKRREELLGIADGAVSPAYPSLTAISATGTLHQTELPASAKKLIRIGKISPEEAVRKAVESAIQGCNVALIANTVGEAQEFFRRIRAEMESGRIPLGMLHSRFPFWRRDAIEEFWLEALGKEAGEKRPVGSILVSTQIIEQSVDLDFDLMISDTAPGELLFQRMGRLWRHCRPSRPLAEPEFWRMDRDLTSASSAEEVLGRAGGSGRVYSPFLLLRAEAVWRKCSRLTLPDDMRPMIEENFRPPEQTEGLERELYDQMKNESESRIRQACTASQLDLISSASAQASDEEDAPTRLSDCPQRTLLLLNSISVRGRECELVLSDGTALTFREEESFSLEKMRILARNTAQVPAWWVEKVGVLLPDALKTYWKYEEPIPVQISTDGTLCLPDGTELPIRYDNDNGICREEKKQRKEEDETVFADW